MYFHNDIYFNDLHLLWIVYVMADTDMFHLINQYLCQHQSGVPDRCIPIYTYSKSGHLYTVTSKREPCRCKNLQVFTHALISLKLNITNAFLYKLLYMIANANKMIFDSGNWCPAPNNSGKTSKILKCQHAHWRSLHDIRKTHQLRFDFNKHFTKYMSSRPGCTNHIIYTYENKV